MVARLALGRGAWTWHGPEVAVRKESSPIWGLRSSLGLCVCHRGCRLRICADHWTHASPGGADRKTFYWWGTNATGEDTRAIATLVAVLPMATALSTDKSTVHQQFEHS